MKTFILITLLLTVLLNNYAHSQETESEFVYDEFIEDVSIKNDVLKIVNDYINEQKEQMGYLTVKDDAANTRRFAIVEIFDVVSRRDNIYTVQVDVDEIGGEPRYLLFFDLKKIDSEFELMKIRIGTRHLRQKSME